MLKNFGDIVNLTLHRIDEDPGDEQIDDIVQSAINNAYLIDMFKNDRRFVKGVFTPEDGIVFLPEDLDTIEKITPALDPEEYRKGNVIITSDKTADYTILYSVVPSQLTRDTDVPDINPKFFYALSTYACYAFYLFKKKTELASYYINEYRDGKEKTHDDMTAEGTAYYYGEGGDE